MKNAAERNVNAFLGSLRNTLENGLNPVYGGKFESYAYDLMAELPWGEEGMADAVDLLKNSDYPSLKVTVAEKFGYDLEAQGGLKV